MIQDNSALPREVQQQQEVHDAGYCMSVHVLLEDNFEGHQGTGLYYHDRKQYLIFTIGKWKSLSDLLQVLADAMKYKMDELRPWSIRLPSGRPSPVNVERDLDRLVLDVAEGQNPWIIFVETVFPDSDLQELPPFVAGRDVLLFFKLYDPKNRRLHYCGHRYFPVKAKVDDLIPLLNKYAGFKAGTPLALYEETESSGIEKIENLNDTLEIALENVEESVIVVFQKDTFGDGDGLFTCEDFYGELPHRVDVTFCDKTIRYDPGIVVTLSLRMRYREVSEAVAERVGTEQHLIQLFTWRNCAERPGAPIQCTFDGTLSQLIKCHKQHKLHSKIFYCILPIPVSQLEGKITIACTWVGRKLNKWQEMTLYPSVMGTVADLLEEARRKSLEMSANGSGKLRILDVNRSKIVSVLKEEMQLQNLKLRRNKMFRIEEVPLEEINLEDDERLTPVMQFFKTTYKPFGIPFLIKVKHMEPFTSVKRRILKKLEIPEEESKEFDICFVAKDKPKRCDESECVNVEKFEWDQTQDNSTPAVYLGLRHLKETRVRYSSR